MKAANPTAQVKTPQGTFHKHRQLAPCKHKAHKHDPSTSHPMLPGTPITLSENLSGWCSFDCFLEYDKVQYTKTTLNPDGSKEEVVRHRYVRVTKTQKDRERFERALKKIDRLRTASVCDLGEVARVCGVIKEETHFIEEGDEWIYLNEAGTLAGCIKHLDELALLPTGAAPVDDSSKV